MTVARRIARNFPTARRGADLAIASNLPSAAGMSSSSALVVATFLALAEANDLGTTDTWRDNLDTPEALAEYLGCIENGLDFGSMTGDRGVGTFGGSQDHTAILCAGAGVVRQYSFSPVRLEAELPWPASMDLVIGVSGVRARKSGPQREAYNRLSMATRVILDRWQRASGSMAATLGAAVEEAGAPEKIRALLEGETDSDFPPQFLIGRFAQFLNESTSIIPAAAAALSTGDMLAFGGEVDRSQRGAEEGLGNQIPETIHLARHARTLGAHAASAFGAGFGGSVWAMVDADDTERFRQAWMDDFRRAFPANARRAQCFQSPLAPPAHRID
jgi:galactokinase